MATVATLPVGLVPPTNLHQPDDPSADPPEVDAVLDYYREFSHKVKIEPGWSSWDRVLPETTDYEQGIKIYLEDSVSDLFAPAGGSLVLHWDYEPVTITVILLAPLAGGVSIIFENVAADSVLDWLGSYVARTRNAQGVQPSPDEVVTIVEDFINLGIGDVIVGAGGPIGRAGDVPESTPSGLSQFVRIKLRRGTTGQFINPFLLFDADFANAGFGGAANSWYLTRHPLRYLKPIQQINKQDGESPNSGNFNILFYPLLYPFNGRYANEVIYSNLEVRMTVFFDTSAVSDVDGLETLLEISKMSFSATIREIWDGYRLVDTRRAINLFFRIYIPESAETRRHYRVLLQLRGSTRIGWTDHAQPEYGRPWTVYFELDHASPGHLYSPVHEFGHMLGVGHDDEGERPSESWRDAGYRLDTIPRDSLMHATYVPGNGIPREGTALLYPTIYPEIHLAHIRQWIENREDIDESLSRPGYRFEKRES